MKRSSDNPNFEFEAKRLHTGHSMRDLVMLLDDSDVSHAIERCREVCRRRGTCLVDVNFETICVFVAQMVQMLFAPLLVSPRNSCPIESRLLNFLAAVRNSDANL